GPCEIDKLAEATGTKAMPLYRLLRACASMGIFAELPGRRFAQTPLSEKLRADVPGSMRNMAIWIGESAAWAAWSRLDHTLRTGQAAFDLVHKKPVFEALGDPAFASTAKAFNNAMTGFSHLTGGAVAKAYDFSGIKTLVDVGGGQGVMLSL